MTGVPLPESVQTKPSSCWTQLQQNSAGLLLPIVSPCFEAGVNQPETLYTETDELWRAGQGKKTQ